MISFLRTRAGQLYIVEVILARSILVPLLSLLSQAWDIRVLIASAVPRVSDPCTETIGHTAIMGCSQASSAEVPSKVEISLRRRSNCAVETQSSAQTSSTTETADGTGKSALHIQGEVMLECDGPARFCSFHSWNHEVDGDDLRMVSAGRALPINKTVHDNNLQKMTKKLSELTKNPDTLKSMVQRRRASCGQEAAGVSDGEPGARPVGRPVRSGHQLPRGLANLPSTLPAGKQMRVSV